MTSILPIGVFDSGKGGMAATRQLQALLPGEKVICISDPEQFPYGEKLPSELAFCVQERVETLVCSGVKLVFVACNSASAVALPLLRSKYALPVVEVIGPSSQKAAALSQGKVGVIGTKATIRSKIYEREILSIAPHLSVVEVSCPHLASLIEEGRTSYSDVYPLLQEPLALLKEARVDTLILGCTHYSFVYSLIEREMGSHVTLVDSAREGAQAVKERLQKEGLERGVA